MRYVALTLVFSMRHATVQVDEHFHQLTSSRLVLAAIIACLRCRVRHRDALHQDCGRDRDAHGSQASPLRQSPSYRMLVARDPIGYPPEESHRSAVVSSA